MIVLDASAAVELVLASRRGTWIARRVAAADITLHAPHLLDLEVSQALRRAEATKQISNLRAREALDDFTSFEIIRYPHEPLLTRIWALRRNLTSYDACYVALAEALGAPLVTCDRRLAAVPGHRARIELPA